MSDNAELAQILQTLLQKERDAHEEALTRGDDGLLSTQRVIAQEWLTTKADLLRAIEVAIGDGVGGIVPQQASQALGSVAILLYQLADGNLPQPVDVIASAPGARPRWHGERRDVAVAVLYIEMVKAGLIADRRFRATVAEAYNVEPSTVDKWRRDETITAGFTPPDDPAEMVAIMKQSGARYHFNRTGERTEGVK